MTGIEFVPARFLRRADGGAALPQDHTQHQSAKPALLILNQPVASLDLLERVWTHTGYRVCADAGANRLYDIFEGLDDADARRREYLPSLIHGDLDSLRADVRVYYAAHGVAITRDPDQSTTDFGKAVKLIPAIDATAVHCHRDVLILGTLGGRVDQAIRLLYDMRRSQGTAGANARLWLFSDSSVSWILPPGESRILIDEGFFTENVGILPAFGPATISTSGLEWDVSDWATSADGDVTTSNHVANELVRVRTDANVLFTIERAPYLP